MTLSVAYREETMDSAPYVGRFEGTRHRGLRQAFQALNPGLLICHPDTFHIRYANAAATSILDLDDGRGPRRIPDTLKVTRQEEYCETERRYVACFRTEFDSDTHDVRALPVYTAGGRVDSVLVVIRDYSDVSWSLFEMLDRIPIAVAAVEGAVDDVRYINRTALKEIYGLRAHGKQRRVPPGKADRLLHAALSGYLHHAPEAGEGQAEVLVGRTKVDMHFARLNDGEPDGACLLYWDPRGSDPIRH